MDLTIQIDSPGHPRPLSPACYASLPPSAAWVPTSPPPAPTQPASDPPKPPTHSPLLAPPYPQMLGWQFHTAPRDSYGQGPFYRCTN